jgi:hypothetical protein
MRFNGILVTSLAAHHPYVWFESKFVLVFVFKPNSYAKFMIRLCEKKFKDLPCFLKTFITTWVFKI